jgi:hypothetical protein
MVDGTGKAGVWIALSVGVIVDVFVDRGESLGGNANGCALINVAGITCVVASAGSSSATTMSSDMEAEEAVGRSATLVGSEGRIISVGTLTAGEADGSTMMTSENAIIKLTNKITRYCLSRRDITHPPMKD